MCVWKGERGWGGGMGGRAWRLMVGRGVRGVHVDLTLRYPVITRMSVYIVSLIKSRARAKE